MHQAARFLMLAGAALFAAGLLLALAQRAGLRPFRLPGDLVFRGKFGVFYFPLATCLIVSLLFSLASWLFRRR